MDKYCCNCKHESTSDDLYTPCNGCYEDNIFNGEQWEEITFEQRELQAQINSDKANKMLNIIEKASESVGITKEQGMRFIDEFMKNTK